MIRILFSVFTLLFLSSAGEASDWPENVSKSLWIPQNAFELERNAHPSYGAYSVAYKMNLCLPATDYLNKMLAHMTPLGWSRLEYDPFNPGLKLNHAGDNLWSIFYDEPGRYYVMQWIDDWKDLEGNYVRYYLRYTAEKGEDLAKACMLETYVLYNSKKAMDEFDVQRPFLEEETNRRAKEWDESLKKRVETIRGESKQSGKITFRLIEENTSSSRTTPEYDLSVPPLFLNVVAANITKRERGNGPMIEIVFTPESAVRMKAFSSKYRGRKIAVLVDGEVIWMPVIRDTIEDIATLRGIFSSERAKEIVNRIMAQ